MIMIQKGSLFLVAAALALTAIRTRADAAFSSSSSPVTATVAWSAHSGRVHQMRGGAKFRPPSSSGGGKSSLSATIAAASASTANATSTTTAPLMQQLSPHQFSAADATATATAVIEKPWLQTIDGIVFVSYLCNVMALSLPVLLCPIAAAERVGSASTMKIASMVAGISSVATLGGATGKFVNGFICQAMGCYSTSQLYFYGLGLAGMLFSVSTSTTFMGLAYAGMEFFASVQWAALAVMLSNYYAKSPAKLAAALTALGLSSTSGQIAAKTLGMTLASSLHWRVVVQIGALTAILGGVLIGRAPQPPPTDSTDAVSATKTTVSLRSIGASLRSVLGSPLFWMLALAHSMAFVARGTDRILGTFFEHMVPGMSQALSGGLTLSITLGLVTGLMTGSRKFTQLEATASAGGQNVVEAKRRFLAKRYLFSFLATMALTATAHFGPALIASKLVLTGLVSLLSGVMAANIAFQYFQFPAMIAKAKFGNHKPVVISFLDGFGFLLSAPIFAAVGRIVPSSGWSSAWGMLAVLFGSASLLMLASIGPVLRATDEPEKEAMA
jgi:hypothetical protein